MCVTLWKTEWREIKFMRFIIQCNKYRLQLTYYGSIPDAFKIKENCTELKLKMAFLAPSYPIKRKEEKSSLQHLKSAFL